MNRLVALCVAALACGPVPAAQTYKWVDERGVTTYGEKPPANRPATAVETQPGGIMESGSLPQKKDSAGTASPKQAVPGLAQAPAAPAARGMEFSTFIRLQVGMNEGEVLLRAGKPDHESVENFRNNIVKSYYYYPTTADPFLTVIKLSGGIVTHLERTKKID